MSDRIKDLNRPSPWNMRIWDEEKSQWLCDGEDDFLPYYGFDIRGGEVTAFQGIDWIYKQHKRWDDFIWERSTGLTDKNGKEIYEGDIITEKYRGFPDGKFSKKGPVMIIDWWVVEYDEKRAGFHPFCDCDDNGEYLYEKHVPKKHLEVEVVGNIHENPELLGGEE